MKKLFLLMVIATVSFSAKAQTEANKNNPVIVDTTIQKEYTCPMHPNVISNKPGTCPDCGMNLVEKKAKMIKSYTCPMHPEVKSDKPGKCPKCGMDLVEDKSKVKNKKKKNCC